MELIERQRRYAEIGALLVKHDLGFVLDAVGMPQLAPKEFQRGGEEAAGLTEPERVRRLFEELGPTFVKMGQILSTRPDLLPHAYVVEFRKLQDAVAPLPYEPIREVIEGDLHAPVTEVFASIEERALASASIGQVHRVVLRDGTAAVVKVQRPGIETTIRRDLAILRGAASVAKASGVLGPIDPVAIVREFEHSILRELDYVTEGRNTDAFREQHAADPQIVIPEVHWEHTSQRVLTLGFVDGVKVSEIERLRAAGHDLGAIAQKLVDVVLSQVFVHGFFHADPHPGNLMVLADGRLALIDFGMAGRFDRATLRALADLVRDLSDRDHERLADHLLRHGLVDYDVDQRALARDLRDLFRLGGHADVHQQMELMMGFVVRYRVAFPPDLFFLDKVFGTLDGAIKTLDPSLTTTELARRFLPRLAGQLAQDWPSLARHLVGRLMDADDALIDVPTQLARVLRRADAGHLVTRSTWQLSPDGERQLSRLMLLGGLQGLALVALGVGGATGDRVWLVLGGLAFATSALGLAWTRRA
ncbi:MAG: phosphotransferase [Alphaproteobacteria bacterium]|nr:phosphotransferase [Alphaproteobacteria bacterium]MCB9699090.1 phosphotransferase [Alphaproteobacteria bacterium]